MSDGYLSKQREEQLAKILDASIDFTDLLKNQKKVLGIFSIGNFMERNDRRIFKAMIAILDDKIIGKNPNQEVVTAIETALSFLEKKDFNGFDQYISWVMSEQIKTPFEPIEKQIFLSVMMMFNGLIAQAVTKIEDAINKADAE